MQKGQKCVQCREGKEGPIPGSIQRQIERLFEQPDLVEDAPAYCSGFGLDEL